MGFPVQSNCLFLVTDSLNAAIVELFKSCWNYHLNGLHWWQFWLVHSSKSGAEKRTLDLCPIFVTNVVKSVIFQKVVIENCVTILLVNIPTVEKTIRALDALSQSLNTILVINSFPLSYKF